MIKSIYKRKVKLEPLKSKSTRRTPTKDEIDKMHLIVLKTEQERGEVDTDLEILNLINEKDKTKVEDTKVHSKELQKHLSLIEKRINMLSNEQKNKIFGINQSYLYGQKSF